VQLLRASVVEKRQHPLGLLAGFAHQQLAGRLSPNANQAPEQTGSLNRWQPWRACPAQCVCHQFRKTVGETPASTAALASGLVQKVAEEWPTSSG